jgi:hypothetical protein
MVEVMGIEPTGESKPGLENNASSSVTKHSQGKRQHIPCRFWLLVMPNDPFEAWSKPCLTKETKTSEYRNALAILGDDVEEWEDHLYQLLHLVYPLCQRDTTEHPQG